MQNSSVTKNSPATNMMNLFDSMRDFARRTKSVRLASPEDIVGEVRHWSPSQLQIPDESKRGEPLRTELEIRAGAPTMDFRVRALTMAERERADAIMDAAVPTAIYIDEAPERPGQPAKRVPAGYDYEDPKYTQQLRPLQDRQSAFVVLCGVDGLREATPGDTDASKTDAIIAAMPTRLVRFLAGEIWNITYAQGDPADFFTSAGSRPSPGSEPSPSKNPAARKRR